jgi:predicted dehydrogenase
MLFGAPAGVDALLRVNGPLGLDVAESAEILLRYDSGVAVQVHLDYWSRPTVHRVEIVCEAGTIRWDYVAGRFGVWSADRPQWQAESYPGVDRRDELFRSEAAHFLQVVEGWAEAACTLADGIAAVRVCAAIERAASRHRTEPVAEC